MAVTAFGIEFDFGALTWSPKIIDVDRDGIKSESIETTHQGSPNGIKTFISSRLVDNGTFKLTVEFNPEDQPPVGPTSEDTYTVTWPLVDPTNTVGAKDEAECFVEEASGNFKLGEKMVQTITIKIAGEVTHTAEA